MSTFRDGSGVIEVQPTMFSGSVDSYKARRKSVKGSEIECSGWVEFTCPHGDAGWALRRLAIDALKVAHETAAHPVDDGVWRWYGFEVRPHPQCGHWDAVRVTHASVDTSWTFGSRDVARHSDPDESGDLPRMAACAFYDAHPFVPKPMREPTPLASAVSASGIKAGGGGRDILIRFPRWPGDDVPWMTVHGQRLAWSDLIDPEPYTPDGA